MASTKQDVGEVVRRGREMYEQRIRAEVEPAHIGEYIAIETQTGAYVLALSREELTQRLFALGPSHTRYLTRVGYPALMHRGGGWVKRPASD